MIGLDSRVLSWKNSVSNLLILIFPLTFVQRKFSFGWEKYFFLMFRDLQIGTT